jgi:5-methylcytosine-specific restriction endonuclease McrA
MPQEGPPSIYGYDGRIHPERATPSEWRRFWMAKARKIGTHTRAQWIELRDRLGHCVNCGAADVLLTKDHIFPVSRGGCDCIENIQPLCPLCNSSKRDRLEFSI